MKKILLLSIAAMLCCMTRLTGAATDGTYPVLPYSIDFTQIKFYGQPDAINASWDFTKWSKVHPSDYSKGFWADYTGEIAFWGENGKIVSGLAAIGNHTGQADAWLITPGLNLEEGKGYEITYTYKRFPGKIKGTQKPLRMTEKFEIGIGNEKTAANLQQRILDTYQANNDEYETGKSEVTIDHSGTYFIGIHLFSDAAPEPIVDVTCFCVGSFSIQEKAIVIPNPVTGLSVVPDPQKKLAARLSWTNPNQWTDGEKITGNMEAEIYRNGERIQTLAGLAPGTVSGFNDIQIPHSGLYEYAVRIKIDHKYSIRVKSEQQEIGSLTVEAYLPYRIDFTRSAPYGQPDDANPACTWEKWTKLNPEDPPAGAWNGQLAELNEGEANSGICAYCEHSGEADAWTISPMIYLEKDKAYALTYSYKKFPGANPEYKEQFEVCLGKEKTADGLNREILAVYETGSDEYRTETIVARVQETGEYCVGLHCISPATGNSVSNLCFGSFSVEETTPVKPGTIADPSVSSSENEMYVVNLSWKNPAQGTKDEPLQGTLTAKIFRDGQLIETLTDIEPGSTSAWSDHVGEKGSYAYAVCIGWRGIYNEITSLGSCELTSFIPLRISDFSGTVEEKKVKLTWTNPAVYSKSGMSPTDIPLPDHFYIDIYRDGALLKTIGNQTPGSKVEYVDQVPSEKKWMYWVKSRLESGETSIESNIITIDLTPVVKPAPVANLQAEADKQEELLVHLSWNNPVSGTKGEDLSGRQFKAHLFKDGRPVETLLYLDAGSRTEWNDRTESEGTYTYSVALELDKICSDTIRVSCYVAYFKPASITDFSYQIDDDRLTLNWISPDKYENGNELKDEMSVHLFCNEELVTTFQNQSPGTPGQYTDRFNPAERKVYFLTVSLPNGVCSARSKTILINGQSDIRTESVRAVYYDRNTCLLHTEKDTNVSVFNVSGTCVFRESKVASTLSLKELSSGIYLIKLDNKGTEFLKVIK